MKKINPVIYKTIIENKNMITTAQVLKLGFSKQLLVDYVKAGLLERIRQGLYALPNDIHDDMYSLMLRSDGIVFSHETALFLNNLSERTPFIHTITMPSDKSIPNSIKNESVCFYVKPNLYKIGLIEKKNTFGNTVRCYDAERTICDLLRSRKRCDEETVISALKNYAGYKNKNLNRLYLYGERFKINSDLKKYMDVLL